MKYCPKCKLSKPLDSYSKNKTKKDGLQVYCKVCKSIGRLDYLESNQKAVRQWHEKNKEYYYTYKKEWRSKNRKQVNSANSKHRANKKKRTPAWANLEKISFFYGVAAYLDWVSGGFVKYHVDHVIPLNGKTVCGLHVENNLQLLKSIDNLRKSNHHDSYLPMPPQRANSYFHPSSRY